MILYIDDEPRYVESFVDELNLEFENKKIESINNTDKAVVFFEQYAQEIEIVILDIMMPSGKVFKDKPTQEGLLTGLFFYEYIREKYIDLPIIIFTNTSEEYIVKSFDDNLDIRKILDQFQEDMIAKKVLYLQKQNIFPYQLVEKVNEMLINDSNFYGEDK